MSAEPTQCPMSPLKVVRLNMALGDQFEGPMVLAVVWTPELGTTFLKLVILNQGICRVLKVLKSLTRI